MKFEAMITGIYEVSDLDLEETYGTTDPDSCAKQDENINPGELVGYLDQVSVTVTAVKP